MKPIVSSPDCSNFGSGTKVARIVGATLRCRHATTLPCASSPASMRSAETVCRKSWWRSSSRVQVTLTGAPPISRDRSAASSTKSGFDFRPKPPPSRVTLTVTSSGLRPSLSTSSLRVPPGLCSARERLIGVALVTHDLARLARGLFQLGLVGHRIVGAVRPVIPLNDQRLASFDRRPSIARDDCDAADRLELRRRRRSLDDDDLLDARHFHRRRAVIGGELAAHHGRAMTAYFMPGTLASMP